MNDRMTRALLYGGAVLMLVGLGYGAATHFARADANVLTLLDSVGMQLRLAYAIPANDKQGKAVSSRENMILDAERNLRLVDEQQPGMAVTAEFRGFAQMLRGDFVAAAASYERARSCSDCQDEQRDVLAFNQARMLAKGGRPEQALAVFGQNAVALDARYGHQRRIEEANLCAQLGRTADATQRLDLVVADPQTSPFLLLQAGLGYLTAGDRAKAKTALQRAAKAEPIADYHLGRLESEQGLAEEALGLLERAAAARPAEVRQLLAKEAAAWSVVAATERFRNLQASLAAAVR